MLFDQPGQHDQPALHGDGGDAVKRSADSGQQGLGVLVERDQIEAVHRDIVRGGGEGEQEKEPDENSRQTLPDDQRRHAGKQKRHQKLGGENPLPLGPEQVDERRPERLDRPRQHHEPGPERDVVILHAERFEQDRRDERHDHIRPAFRKISGRNPEPGAFFTLHGHNLLLYRKIARMQIRNREKRRKFRPETVFPPFCPEQALRRRQSDSAA